MCLIITCHLGQTTLPFPSLFVLNTIRGTFMQLNLLLFIRAERLEFIKENKKVRKQERKKKELDQESDQEKKERKHAFDQESDRDRVFFLFCIP